ncbi:MAG: restriction endonuclease subunit S, partial [Candidatus Moranbacteria bacterium]|nr:restriction endonuclease subunit S [Candidatus Moranbacteria bacterium]
GDGFPFYQGVTEFRDKYVDIKTFTNQPTKIIEANSILFSVRAPVGRVNFTKHKACIGRGNAGLRMKNSQQDFLYFLLKKNEKAFLSNTTGTVFDSISGGQLRDFEILIPIDKEEQRAIASVLSSLDNKIELLREHNKTLEVTAQAIFKEWFVHFNFPDKDGKPYKTNGGKMIDSELGEIPEGWRVGTVNDFIKREILSYRCDQDDLSPKGKTPIIDQGANGLYGYTEREPDFEANTENPVILFTNHTCNMWFVNYPFCAIQNVIPFRGNSEYDILPFECISLIIKTSSKGSPLEAFSKIICSRSSNGWWLQLAVLSLLLL